MAGATARRPCPICLSSRAVCFTSVSESHRGESPSVLRASSSEDTKSAESIEVESLTITQLKAVLRSRGEKLSGKKQELVARVSQQNSLVVDAAEVLLLRSVETSSAKQLNPKSKNNNKPPPVLRWEVTDPPLPPRKDVLPSDSNNTLRVVSWNVNGIRALLGKDGDILDRLAFEENADVVCLQETKIQEKDVDAVDVLMLAEYPYRVWNCSTARLGYSGTALFSKTKPINTWCDPFEVLSNEGGDTSTYFQNEGRVVVFEYAKCFVVGAYVPNSGAELKRLGPRTNAWDPSMSRYLKSLETQKPVVYCGDLNVAADKIDLWGNHAANSKSAGFTPEERNAFGKYYGVGEGVTADTDTGVSLVDTFRHVHGNASAYSWFSYRGGARNKNRGWRIDYLLASNSEKLIVHDAYIRGDMGGSDHCPVGAVFRVGEELLRDVVMGMRMN